MGTNTLFLANYVGDLSLLRTEGRVMAWLDALATMGYSVLESAEYLQRPHVRGKPVKGVSAEARTHAESFCRGEARWLNCVGERDGYFHIDPGISPEDGFVVLAASDAALTNLDDVDYAMQCFEAFVEAAAATYEIWHPVYGVSFGGAWVAPLVTYAEALALHARSFSNINIFGPEFVAKIGRERLLSAPAWRVRPFDDGGVMVVATPFIRDPRETHDHSLDEVAKHIGIPRMW